MIRLSEKDLKAIPYAVKATSQKAEVDGRTVDMVANTYYYVDTYGDVLVEGCCSKSIADRGPDSTAPGKIKHIANHDLSTGIGRIEKITEEQVEGKHVLRAQSWMSETTAGEETLIKYKEGLIDQHSIGFNYMDLEWIDKDSDEYEAVACKLINPEEAERWGGVYLVKEIKLFEISSLDGFGANRLTPALGIKTDNKQVQYNNLIAKFDALQQAMRSGGNKDMIQLQEKQIKQMIYELYHVEPDFKGTKRPPDEPTFKLSAAISNIKL
jgi:HK97 family phage prohead protease